MTSGAFGRVCSSYQFDKNRTQLRKIELGFQKLQDEKCIINLVPSSSSTSQYIKISPASSPNGKNFSW